MGAFEYTALDPSGKERKGLLEGDTAKAVRQSLRDKKLMPLKITEVAQKEAERSKGISLGRGISAMDLALITRQLATLVKAALPVEEALLAVSQQTEKPRIKSMLLGVRSRVMEGHTLADGLKDFPNAFPEIYVATVAAGEQSGKLDAVLERLADYTDNRQQLRQRITHALVYPISVAVVALAVVVGLLTYVVPKVVEVYDNIDQELPALTQSLIATSDFLRENGFLLVVFLIGGLVGLNFLFKQQGPKRALHAWLLRLPLIGRIVRGVNTANFSRTLHILAGSGVPVLEALRIAASVVSNIPMREAVEEAADRIREGAAIGRSLAVSKLFPPMTIHLISSGEASGELDTMLERAAVYQEREMNAIIATLMALVEPVLILTMGGVVLLIVLALLLPIVNLNDLVQ